MFIKINLSKNFKYVQLVRAYRENGKIKHEVKNAKIPASPQHIRDTLNSMQFAEVALQGSKFFIKTKSETLASQILRLLKIESPKNITPVTELTV